VVAGARRQPTRRIDRHCIIVRTRGAVMDADFFRYSAEVRRKIEDVFVFMWLHDLGKSPLPLRIAKRVLFETSRALHGISSAGPGSHKH
jgi:hypothetical protein